MMGRSIGMHATEILFGVLVLCVPVAGFLYWRIVRRISAQAPGLLGRIDPRGFRAMNASSQLRFSRFVVARSYRDVEDPDLVRLLDGFRWLFFGYGLGWAIWILLMLP